MTNYKEILNKEILKNITIKDIIIVALVPTVITIGYYGFKAYKAHKEKKKEGEILPSFGGIEGGGSEKLEVSPFGGIKGGGGEETKVIPITRGQEVKENLEIDNTKWVKTN